MGSEQSRESNNEQRTRSRNYTEAEVRRALDLQKSQLEREMNDLLRSQAASATTSPCSSTSSSTIIQRVADYSTRSNVAQGVNQNRAPPLYPTLPTNGIQATGTNYNPENPVNVYDTRRYGPTTSTPSAPPMPAALVRQGRPISRKPVPRQKAESDDVACRTCKYRYTEKIFNCESGHASCSECMTTQQQCGECGRRITDMRNITMEEYVTQKQISCPNADEGCSYSITPGNLERHLQECPFKEVQCMMPGDICIWKGKLSKLADHFDQYHSTNRGELDTDTLLELNNTSKTIQLIKLGKYNFLIHQYTVNKNVFVAAQVIGNKGCASKWSYELQFFKKAEPRRKYVYVDKCFSMSESFDDIVKESACAVLPMEYAKTFDNGSGVVVYKYYIKKEVGRPLYHYDREERKRDGSCTRGGRGRGGRGRGRGRVIYAN